jgi:glycine betaine/proline transport system permease protein
MDWLFKFPSMNEDTLRALKKSVDEGFRTFTRGYGSSIETLFSPLQSFLIWAERLITGMPWPLVIAIIGVIAWFATRSWRIVVGCIVTLLLIGYFDMWEDTMKTVSMIFVCTVLSIAIGIPMGIACPARTGCRVRQSLSSTSCRRCRASSTSFPSSCCSASAGCQASSLS